MVWFGGDSKISLGGWSRWSKRFMGGLLTVVRSAEGWLASLGHDGPIYFLLLLFDLLVLIHLCSRTLPFSLSLSLVLWLKIKCRKIVVHFTLKSILFYSQRENDLRLIGFFNLPKHLQSYKMFSVKCFQSNQMQPYYHNKIYNGVVNMLWQFIVFLDFLLLNSFNFLILTSGYKLENLVKCKNYREIRVNVKYYPIFP